MPAPSFQEQLFAHFPELSPRPGAADGILAVNAPAALLVELATTLRDKFGFSVLADIAGCDWGLDAYRRFGAIYHFQRPPAIPAAARESTGTPETAEDGAAVSTKPAAAGEDSRLTLRVACDALDNATPSLPSLAHLYASALWFEREAYDLLGIRFDGHPSLSRLLLPEDFGAHPLRKDYPLRGNHDV
ncbi:MAG: NADH-quinone oxidoreductase subunit C [Puniceicoccales bacterium]|jgi:NADH-quinone oxidoreductase subunit C|nr:NADH-quinone oxidoreductase subunit C [Puniceicoccales bacterium]